MDKVKLPKVSDEIRKIAKEHGNLYAHYYMLVDRAGLLLATAVTNLDCVPFDKKDELARRDIYRLENINQLLSALLGIMQNKFGNTATSISQNIMEDRAINEHFRKEFQDEQDKD